MAAAGKRPVRQPPPFLSHMLDLLAPLGPVQARAMFGGWALSLDGRTFALVASDELYFKVDDQNRPDYLERGCRPFAPFPDQPDKVLNYYPPPAEALDDAASLLPWASTALEAALRAAMKKRPRKR